MANTTPLTYRVDSDLKIKAESIIEELGMTPTVAIQIFYKKIIMEHGLPFDVKLKYPLPVSLDSISSREIDYELNKGFHSLQSEKTYSPDEVDELLAKEFGI